jgi:hypothetical protein
VTDAAHVRERVVNGWDHLAELVDSLGTDELAMSGSDGWAVKDHLAHIAAWERSLLAIFEGADRIKAMGLPGGEMDTDEINRAVWELNRNRSQEDALAYFRDTHANLVRKLDSMSDADFDLPYAHYQPSANSDDDGDRPVVAWVAGDTYEHYFEHIDWIRALISQRI